MIEVTASVARERRLAAGLDRAWSLLQDVPAWGPLFPRVESVEPLGGHPGAFVWRMAPLGPPGGRVRVVYACRYTPEPETHTLRWAPVAGVGNARFAGACALRAEGGGVVGTLAMEATLEIPAPRFVRPVVEATLRPEMGRMVDTFLDRLDAALG